MMFDAADLAAFVDPDMPGYISATIAGLPVGGLFSAAYSESFGIVSGTSPSLRVLGSVAVDEGDLVVTSFGSFTVASIESPLGSLSMKLIRLESV